MGEDTLARAVHALETVRERPLTFFGVPTVESVETFLNGFALACWAFDTPLSAEVQRKAMEKRGWSRPAAGPVPQMRERGLSEAEIIDELLLIEIITLQIASETPAA